MKAFILALTMVAGIAHAEVQYNYKNPSHSADVDCIAALSIARDRAMEDGDNASLRKYTNIQNKIYLKYTDNIPYMHIEASKIILKNTRTAKSTLASCLK